MARFRSDWIVNLLLTLCILALLGWMGWQSLGRGAGNAYPAEDLLAPGARERLAQARRERSETPYDAETPYAATAAPSRQEAARKYPNIGANDIFRALITPTPPPPPPTPKPTPTPSLARAVEGWVLQYPINRRGQPTIWVFQDKRNQEHRLTEGQPYPGQDVRRPIEILAQPGSNKYEVRLTYQGQEQVFSLIE